MANPLALSAVTVTNDGIIILQSRSQNVAEYSNRWHVTPSGHAHPPQTLASALKTELWEELAVKPDEIKGEIIVTGLIVNRENGKPELTLLMRLNIPAADALKRSAQDRWEYERLQTVTWESYTIKDWLQHNSNSCVPPGHAALVLAGRVDFGDDWKDKVLDFE